MIVIKRRGQVQSMDDRAGIKLVVTAMIPLSEMDIQWF